MVKTNNAQAWLGFEVSHDASISYWMNSALIMYVSVFLLFDSSISTYSAFSLSSMSLFSLDSHLMSTLITSFLFLSNLSLSASYYLSCTTTSFFFPNMLNFIGLITSYLGCCYSTDSNSSQSELSLSNCSFY